VGQITAILLLTGMETPSTANEQEEQQQSVTVECQEVTLIVDESQEKVERLDKYIAGALHLSRRISAQIIEEGKVTINGTIANKTHYKVKPKDEVVVLLPNNPKDEGGEEDVEDKATGPTVPDLGRKRGRKRRNMPNTRKMMDKHGKRDKKTKPKGKQQQLGSTWTLSDRVYQEVLGDEPLSPTAVDTEAEAGAEEGAATTESALVNPDEISSLRDPTNEKVTQDGFLIVDGSYLEGTSAKNYLQFQFHSANSNSARWRSNFAKYIGIVGNLDNADPRSTYPGRSLGLRYISCIFPNKIETNHLNFIYLSRITFPTCYRRSAP